MTARIRSLSERVLENPVLYDAVQRVAGIERLRRRLAPILGALEPGALLDVGAGTGAFQSLLPPHVQYVPLDVDPRKLDRLSKKLGGVEGVVGSATRLPFEDDSFDYTLCTNVAHHLPEPDLDRMLDELRRVTRRQTVFVDPLRTNRVASKALWRIDRGSHPRSYADLIRALTSRFETLEAETLTYLHRYIVFVGTPR